MFASIGPTSSPSRIRRIRAFALALPLASIFALAPIGIQAQVEVIGSLVHEHRLGLGEERSGTVKVRNASGEPQEVEIRKADYHFDAAGHSEFPAPGTHPRSNAGWISFSPSFLVLAPGQEALVTYQVRAPSAAAAQSAGTFWSVFLIEARPPLPADPVRAGGFGVAPQIRYAVQIASHLAGDARFDLALSGLRLERSDESAPTLTFDLENTGEEAYRPQISLQVYSEDGVRVGTFQQDRGLLLPGTGLRQRFELRDLAPGTYEAFLTVETGHPEIHGSQFQIIL